MQPTSSRRERPSYDQALKRMLTRAHESFLQLIAPGVVWVADRSTELPTVARRADLVWEVLLQRHIRALLHIELQVRPDPDIGERLADYGIRLWLRDRLPALSIVVFLRPADTVPTSPFVVKWGRRETLRYSFEVVRLWEIPAERVLATAAYDLWPLATLMAGATVEMAVSVAERIAEAPIPPVERGELTGLLVVLSELRLGRREVLQALRRNPMIDELVKQSSLAEEFYEEGRTEGLSVGVRQTVRSVLEGRFGELSPDLLAALESADAAKLQEIAPHAGTDTLEQIRARLGLAG